MSAIPPPDVLVEAGRRLIADAKKNSHFTKHPMFTVQRESRVYHLNEGEGDGGVWVERSTDSDIATHSERIERRFQRGWPIPERFERIEYVVRWEFVDAYLTPEAAEARVQYETAKHHGTFRVYVESGYRNAEWQAMRAWLMALAAAAPEVKP